MFSVKLSGLLPKWLYHFTFPLRMCESSSCSTSPKFGVNLLNFSHSSGFIIAFHCGFNFHFCYEHVEHLFKYLLIIYVFVFVQIFWPLLLSVFLLTSYRSFKKLYP